MHRRRTGINQVRYLCRSRKSKIADATTLDYSGLNGLGTHIASIWQGQRVARVGERVG